MLFVECEDENEMTVASLLFHLHPPTLKFQRGTKVMALQKCQLFSRVVYGAENFRIDF
jgi:hypothetical protein